mgnify:FL=1
MNMEIMPVFAQETLVLSMSPGHPPQGLSAPVDSPDFAAVFAAIRETSLESGLSRAISASETLQTDASATASGNTQESETDEAAASVMTAGDAGYWAAATVMTMENVSMMETAESGAWLAAALDVTTAQSPGTVDGAANGNASLVTTLSCMDLNASSQSGGHFGSAAPALNANMPGAALLASGAPGVSETGVQPNPASLPTTGRSAAGVAVVLDSASATQAAEMSSPGTTPETTAAGGPDAQSPPTDAASRTAALAPLRIAAATSQGADAPEAAVRIQDADVAIVSRYAPLPGHEERLLLQDEHLPGVKDALPLHSDGAPEAARAGASVAVPSWTTEAARGVAPPVAESPARAQAPVGMESIGAAALRSIRYLASKGGDRSLTVRLVPESLGEMRVEVLAQSEEIFVRIVSANPVVRESMQAQVHDLRQSLAREGIEVTRVDIAASMSQDADQGGRHPPEAVPQHVRWTSPGRAPYDDARETAAECVHRRGRPHHGVLNVFV